MFTISAGSMAFFQTMEVYTSHSKSACDTGRSSQLATVKFRLDILGAYYITQFDFGSDFSSG